MIRRSYETLLNEARWLSLQDIEFPQKQQELNAEIWQVASLVRAQIAINVVPGGIWSTLRRFHRQVILYGVGVHASTFVPLSASVEIWEEKEVL